MQLCFRCKNFAELHPELNQSYVQHKPVKFHEDKRILSEEEFPELQPYRSLDASRLKLVGRGCWPMDEFISGPLWLPFMEPRFLMHGAPDDKSVWPVSSLEIVMRTSSLQDFGTSGAF